jgi:hypothetical protein
MANASEYLNMRMNPFTFTKPLSSTYSEKTVLRIRIRIIVGSRLRHQSEKLDPDPHQVKIQELWRLKMKSWTLTWKRGGSKWSRGRSEGGTGSIIVKSRKRKRIRIRIYVKIRSGSGNASKKKVGSGSA